LFRFGKGFTLQVKIGSPDDFIGAISEPILLRGRHGSRYGSRHESPTRRVSTTSEPPRTPTSPEPTGLNDIIDTQSAVQNFHNFIMENFQESVLIEEHQVMCCIIDSELLCDL